MTSVDTQKMAAIGAAFLFVGIVLAWYCEIAEIGKGPALLVQSVGALLLAVGLCLSI